MYFQCFKVLYNRDKLNDLTNYDLNRRLHRIQTLIQTHHDYKQSEVRLVLYIDMYFIVNYYTRIGIDVY